jgi:hypothetical protein
MMKVLKQDSRALSPRAVFDYSGLKKELVMIL